MTRSLCLPLLVCCTLVAPLRGADPTPTRPLNVDAQGNPTLPLRVPVAALPSSVVRDYVSEATAGIDPLLVGTPSAANLAIFSSDDGQYHYVRNTGAWFSRYQADLTCVSAQTSVGWRVTAIDGMHGITAHHIGFPAGGDLWFCDANNATVHVTATAVANIAGDLDLVTFSAALPATVHPARIMPSPPPFTAPFAGCPVLYTTQRRQALVTNLQAIGANDLLVQPTSGLRVPWSLNPPQAGESSLSGFPFVQNDSSSPYFLVSGGHLVLLGCAASYNGDGPDPGANIAALTAVTGPDLTAATMPVWPEIVGPAGPQGPVGPTGPSPVIVSAGTTTTLAPGSQATVTGVTTGGTLTLNFGIPRGTTGAGAGAASTGNLLYCDVTGNDSTGVRNDPSHPFASGFAAQAAAQSGDVIVVRPGTYTDCAGWAALGKDGVDWYLMGAHIQLVVASYNDENNSEAAISLPLSGIYAFGDHGDGSGNPVSYNVRGWGSISVDTSAFNLANGDRQSAIGIACVASGSVLRVDSAIRVFADDGLGYNQDAGNYAGGAYTAGIVNGGGTVYANGFSSYGRGILTLGGDYSGGVVYGNGTSQTGAGIESAGGNVQGSGIGTPAVKVDGSNSATVTVTGRNESLSGPCITTDGSATIILQDAVLITDDHSACVLNNSPFPSSYPSDLVVYGAFANVAPNLTGITPHLGTITVSPLVQ